MKKIFAYCALFGLLVACQSKELPEVIEEPKEVDEVVEEVVEKVKAVESLSLDKTIVSVKEGGSVNLSLTIKPDDATNKNVVWSSTNTNVATVDNGTVTGVEAGSATIIATSEDGGKTAMCVIRVQKDYFPSETDAVGPISAVSAVLRGKVNLDSTVPSDLRVGFQVSLSSDINSSNSMILDAFEADCNYNYAATLVGLAPSITYYYRTYIYQNGKESFGETMSFTTKDLESLLSTDEVSDINSNGALLKGRLDLTDVLFNDIRYGFIWGDYESDDQHFLEGGVIEDIYYTATVDNLLPLTPYWFTACVLIDDQFLYGDIMSFYTNPIQVQSVSLDRNEYLFNTIGSTLALTATILPADATDQSILWSSNNESVVTVDQNGLVKAIGNGTATITATTNDQGKTASCSITVAQLVTGIMLDKTEIKLNEDKTEKLTATIAPDNANDKTVIWSSSDANIAKVDSDGLVTALSQGTATITASANDGGGASASCTVIVIHVDVVDLGLSVYWSKYNLCESGLAGSQEDFGDYFAWGETEPYYISQDPLIWKSDYTYGYYSLNYKWYDSHNKTYTRYNLDDSYGPVDNKTEFKDYDYEDDAARQILGGSWRIPTDAEWTELRSKCTWRWTTLNGVSGRLITGPNGNTIFLPAAGYRDGTSLFDAGGSDPRGHYWSSTLYSDSPKYAWEVMFWYGSILRRGEYCYRHSGYSIRPVTD